MGRKMGGSSPPFVSIARIRSSRSLFLMAFPFSYGRDSSFSGCRVIITIITPLVRAPSSSFFYFPFFLHFLTIRHTDARAGQRGKERGTKNSKVSSPLFCRLLPLLHHYKKHPSCCAIPATRTGENRHGNKKIFLCTCVHLPNRSWHHYYCSDSVGFRCSSMSTRGRKSTKSRRAEGHVGTFSQVLLSPSSRSRL